MTQTASHFDAIVVGARVAGSAAAIVLGRNRLRHLLIDKAGFPSHTISTHIVLSGGASVLARLGAIGMLERVGGVRFGRMRTVGPGFDYTGDLGWDRGLCLRRLSMDAVMLDCARSFDSVQVRERFRVTGLVIEEGQVRGVRGEDAAGAHEFRAPLVIGADGMRSLVARTACQRAGGLEREDTVCARAYYYAYFRGVKESKLGDELVTEFQTEDGAANLACRCDGGLVVAAVAFDAGAMSEFRRNLAANFMRRVSDSPALGPLLEGAALEGRILSPGPLLNTYRAPATDGCLLLGDAGLHVDPLFGQGHTFALKSAELLGELAPRWFADGRTGEALSAEVLSEFGRRRDEHLMPYYLASVRVSRELGLDRATLLAHRAAAAKQWAADEMARFAQMADASTNFPSFRFARLMARQARGA